MNGGSISITSEVGMGTDFIITMKAKCRVNEKEIKLAESNIENLGFDPFDHSD